MNSPYQNLVFLEKNQERLDKFLVEKLSLSRSQIQKLIQNKQILVDGEPKPNNYKLSFNQKIEVLDLNFNIKPSHVIPNKDIELDILYEDEHLLVINKQNDLVVHMAPGHYEDTLVNGLKYYLDKNLANHQTIRPGIVHRIDRYTTGILVVAKNDTILTELQNQFQEHTIIRKYHALVHGVMNKNKILINLPIKRSSKHFKKMEVTHDGKPAKTIVNVLTRFSDHTYLELELLTGRTHQIRVHLNYIDHPVIGDHLYGLRADHDHPYGQYLHAFYLKFFHPILKKELTFEIPDPQEFKSKIKVLSNKKESE